METKHKESKQLRHETRNMKTDISKDVVLTQIIKK